MNRSRGPRRRVAVVALLMIQVVLASLYGAASPPFEGPDAIGHVNYIVRLQEMPFGMAILDARTAAASHQLVQQPPLYYRSVALLLGGAPARPAAKRFSLNPHYPGLSHRVSLTPIQEDPEAEWPLRLGIWMSMLAGVLAAACAYGIGTALRRQERSRGLPLAMLAVVAFNPQFLFAAGSIGNDAFTAGLVALSLYLALRLARSLGARTPALRWAPLALGLGLSLGSAALAKYSGLLITAPIALILLPTARRVEPRRIAGALWLTAGGALLIAGRWYGSNMARFGSPVPVAQMQSLLGDLARPSARSWFAALDEARWVRHSYWGVFGHGVLAPDWVFWLSGAIVGLGLVGLVRALSARRQVLPPWIPVCVGLYGLSFLQWIRWMHDANQGRLLFPAATAVAATIAIGWGWLPGVQADAAHGILVALMLILGISQLGTLHAAYDLPTAVNAPRPEHPTDAIIGPGLRLVGYDLPHGAQVLEGERLPIRLYWQAAQIIDQDLRTFVQLLDDQSTKLAAIDHVPLGGRHPTRQWRPGQTFAEDIELVPRGSTQGEAFLIIGAHPEGGPPVMIHDSEGTDLGQQFGLSTLQIESSPDLQRRP